MDVTVSASSVWLTIDLYRHVRPRTGLDVVLAGADLGPHACSLRGEPEPARTWWAFANPWLSAIVGIIALGLFFAGSGWVIHKLVTRTPLERKLYERTNTLQYLTFQFFAITILVGLPAKMLLRLLFRIKYVLVTPWFNI